MVQRDAYAHATRTAEILLKDEGITELPVDPREIAESMGITVQAMSVPSKAFSGVLMKIGDALGIGYATHFDNEGFDRFSIGHELGHYCLNGHCDHLLSGIEGQHESRAGFHLWRKVRDGGRSLLRRPANTEKSVQESDRPATHNWSSSCAGAFRPVHHVPHGHRDPIRKVLSRSSRDRPKHGPHRGRLLPV